VRSVRAMSNALVAYNTVEWGCACGQSLIVTKAEDPKLFQQINSGEMVFHRPCPECGRTSVFLEGDLIHCFNLQELVRQCRICKTSLELSPDELARWAKGEPIEVQCGTCKNSAVYCQGDQFCSVVCLPPRREVRCSAWAY